MTYELEANTFWTILAATTILVYGLLRILEYLVREIHRKGKAQILWLDADGGDHKLQFHTRNGNEVTLGKGDKAKTYILQAQARIPGKYPLWVVNPRHGLNYAFPTDAQTIDAEKKLAFATLSNPLSYHKAQSRTEWADTLRAQDDTDRWGWVMPVAMVGLVALLGLFGMVGWVVYKIANSQGVA